ncbi:hypothetical protein LFTC9L10_ODKFFKCD_01505 [Limosilactobacillus fermentum]
MNIGNTLYHGSKNNFNEFEIPKYHTNGYLYTVELTDECHKASHLMRLRLH